jgi:hypothetical protein
MPGARPLQASGSGRPPQGPRPPGPRGTVLEVRSCPCSAMQVFTNDPGSPRRRAQCLGWELAPFDLVADAVPVEDQPRRAHRAFARPGRGSPAAAWRRGPLPCRRTPRRSIPRIGQATAAAVRCVLGWRRCATGAGEEYLAALGLDIGLWSNPATAGASVPYFRSRWGKHALGRLRKLVGGSGGRPLGNEEEDIGFLLVGRVAVGISPPSGGLIPTAIGTSRVSSSPRFTTAHNRGRARPPGLAQTAQGASEANTKDGRNVCLNPGLAQTAQGAAEGPRPAGNPAGWKPGCWGSSGSGPT